MIRLIYWFVVLIEIILLLCVLFLFIVTDSRTVTVLAEKPLNSFGFTYSNLEGNLLLGLKIKKLKYKNKVLFNKATIHWNPLSLLNKKLTLTQLDAEGVDLDNIITMVNHLSQHKKESDSKLKLAVSLDNIHLDINPFVYEGVKFSSFLLETKKINIDKDFHIDTEKFYLHFNSDLVNVNLKGKIDDNNLLISTLDLKEISSKDITSFVKQVLKKKKKEKRILSQKKSKAFIPFKQIKIRKIRATQKAVKYGSFKIKKVLLILENAEIYPSKNYSYDVKRLTFMGKTNFGKLKYKGFVKNSTIHAKGEIVLDKYLFKKYHLPLNFKNLKKLPSTLKLTHKGVWIEIDHKVAQLLKIKNSFNIDVHHAKHQLHYDYSIQDLTVESEILASIPYANTVSLRNKTLINKHGRVSYKGEASFKQFTSKLPQEVKFLLTNLYAGFEGDVDDIRVNLDSDRVQGNFQTQKYKTAWLELQSKKGAIFLGELLKSVPDEYRYKSLAFKSKTYLDFSNNALGRTNLDISSNLVNLDLLVNHSDFSTINFKARFPQNTLFQHISKELNFQQLGELNGKVIMHDSIYDVQLSNYNLLELFFRYDSNRKKIEKGSLVLGHQKVDFYGTETEELSIKTHIDSLQTFFQDIGKYYSISFPSLEGVVDVDMRLNNAGISLSLKSKSIQYFDSKNIETAIEDITVDLKIDKAQNIELEHYTFRVFNNNYMDTFYSTKSAYFKLNGSELTIKRMWLNDEILLEGFYNLNTQQGSIQIDAENFSFKNKDFDLLLHLDLQLKLDGKFKNLSGNIQILGNNITYEVLGSGLVEDSDIIIVEDLLKEEETAFKNLKMYVKIDNKNPLYYYGKDVNIELYNQLSVVKNYGSEMMITGMSTITKGYYIMEDKRFVLDESHVYFTGDIKKPLLDIKANYEKDEYLVHVFISGTTDTPIVNFNSDPYLTQQEILSLILFDGTGSGGGAEAYTLLGGTFAKGLMKSLGISVDHFLLGTDANDELSLEIGRKVSDNISVLYMHRDGRDGVKVRVEHSRSFETDIIIQPPNTSSIEFLYKQDR